MTNKAFPLGKGRLEEVAAEHPTPFYLYDEAAIRANARAIRSAFAVFPRFFLHFAVKALPNPAILRILREEGFGADCSSLPELLLARMAGISGGDVMFSSNDTPSGEFRAAADMGAAINLDDITHIDFLDGCLGGLPELVCLRYNPGPLKLGNAIIGNPTEAKFGLTGEQIFEGFAALKGRGVGRFALHTMVASNELDVKYHLETGKLLFSLAVELKRRLGVELEFVNLGGGVGIPYRPEEAALDYGALACGLKALFDGIVCPAGLEKLAVRVEWGRVVTGPYGWLVSRAIHRKNIYRSYIGLDASMADLMRPALYGAYHHITVAGKEGAPPVAVCDVVGSLCENNDKFAIGRALPAIDVGEASGDLVIIHDAGAHGRAMGFNYNGKLRAGELLLREDGSVVEIRRRETVDDYFATLV
ncbi:MAG: diaminopimelate decarboxylase [Spirochaetaceae bacterium]|jgi:diaminopimelate decarboxylase|nr:diaminopimelate decarboxylase [Spirochaetaceae bacterium]